MGVRRASGPARSSHSGIRAVGVGEEHGAKEKSVRNRKNDNGFLLRLKSQVYSMNGEERQNQIPTRGFGSREECSK